MEYEFPTFGSEQLIGFHPFTLPRKVKVIVGRFNIKIELKQHDIEMAKEIERIVNELTNSNWKPKYHGEFGMKVHELVTKRLNGKGQWVCDVWVDPDGKILSIGQRPQVSIPQGTVQIDALYLKPEFKLKVGEKFNSDAVEDLYEIKTSAEGWSNKEQIEKLKGVMNGRPIKIVRSPLVWQNNQWQTNPIYRSRTIPLKALSAALTVQKIGAIIATDVQDELLVSIMRAIQLIRAYVTRGDTLNLRLEMYKLVTLLKQYFEPFNPSRVTNVKWWRLARVVLELI